METLTQTLVSAAGHGLPAGLNELNRCLIDLGWSPIGSTAPPYCKQWEAEGIRLFLSEIHKRWLADVIFREIVPADVDERGGEALEEASTEQIPFYRETCAKLIAGLDRYITVSPSGKLSFDDCNFTEWTEWKIAGQPFVMGVSVTDIDVPVTVMARTWLGSSRL